MSEPGTLATLGSAALTQGISFLYGQAAELLKLRRERKKRAGNAAAPALPSATTVEAPILDGKLNLVQIDEEVLRSRREVLLALTERLSPYANGSRVVEPSNAELVAQVEALRGLLELAYRQRITFRGEARGSTGGRVDLKLVAARVEGELTMAEVEQIKSGGRVSVTGELGEVGRDAKVTGFRGDVVGG